MFQTTDILLDYLLVFLPSCFSRFFYCQFFVFFFCSWFYLFILFIGNFYLSCVVMSLYLFSIRGNPLAALSFKGMSCRRSSLSRPCPQFFYECDILGMMMRMIMMSNICNQIIIKKLNEYIIDQQLIICSSFLKKKSYVTVSK